MREAKYNVGKLVRDKKCNNGFGIVIERRYSKLFSEWQYSVVWLSMKSNYKFCFYENSFSYLCEIY